MDKYNISGMSCAACQARVEKAVSEVKGVDACNVNLLTNTMAVEGSATKDEIIKAVENAGYGAAPLEEKSSEDILKDTETPKLKKRLILSVGFLLVLMYFSMGHMMLHFPVPSFMHNNMMAMGLVQMALTIVIMYINRKFFISGFKGMIHGAPNMDTLVALGSGASFIYSVFAMISGKDDLYFESAAMILTLITVGKMLEAMSKGRTTDAIKSLMKLAPKTAIIIDSYGKEKEVSIESVKAGDIFVVRPGESIPVDGIVIEGNSAVNEAALTGESIPVDKYVGSEVSAATINSSGFMKCRATRVGKDTTLSQIIQMVSDAAATKAPIAKIADRVSGVFVPAVIVIALLTIVIWLLVGADFGYALTRGIAVLVISCPCALGLATPVAIMVGNGVGAKNGIMFKTAATLENTGKTQIVALDKTGTITEGEPVVTDVFTPDSITRSGYSLINESENKLLKIAGLLEKKSEHPLAKAVVSYVGPGEIYYDDLDEDDEEETDDITDFEVLPGHGLKGKYHGHEVIGASLRYIEKIVKIHPEIREKTEGLAAQGKTPLCFAMDGKLLGIIAVADTIKKDSAKAVKELKDMGIHVIMITGDNLKTARAIGDQAGVDEIISEVLPKDKEAIIRKLSETGKVAMVGDGINDAPALTRADTGIAIGAGTDVAIDAADVVLMKSNLVDVAAAIRLSRATLRNIHQNLFWAFFYNVIGIPLAAGAYIHTFGWELSPMFGAAAMSLSSFFVVTNALRLNLLKIYDPSGDKPVKGSDEISVAIDNMTKEETLRNKQANESEEIKMATKTIRIEGMMCEHCEARVKKALEAIDGVASAKASHTDGNAVVELSSEVDNEALKGAVEDQDYKVLEIL